MCVCVGQTVESLGLCVILWDLMGWHIVTGRAAGGAGNVVEQSCAELLQSEPVEISWLRLE